MTGLFGALDLNLIQIYLISEYLSQVMRKPGFCISKNKDGGNLAADQRFCFLLNR